MAINSDEAGFFINESRETWKELKL